MAGPDVSVALQTPPKRPADRQIAFAISVVRSKPQSLPIKEYIRLLRQHVAKGRRENALSSAHRHLDRSSYWQSEYERVRHALSVSQGETLDLRKEIDSLKARLDNTKGTNPNKKRKKIDEDVIPVRRDPKKAKRDSSPSRVAFSADIDIGRDLALSDVGETGNMLMRSLYQVYTAVKSRHRAEPAVLAHHLVQAASALPQGVREVIDQSLKCSVTDSEMLEMNFTAFAKAIAFLVVGYNRLTHVTQGTEAHGQVVYAYINMYCKLLENFELVSHSRGIKTNAETSTSGAVAIKGKSKGNAIASKTPNLKDDQTLNILTRFLCGTIDSLDPKVEAHKSLFEGFAYGTLRKLGARLFASVFGSPRDSTLEEQIGRINEPDDIQDSSQPIAPSAGELEIRKAKLEAPYLIHLLTRLMNAAPAHLGAIISTKTGKAKQANNKGSVKGALAVNAKDCLQRTLVNCIFGTEGLKEDDPFMNCLKMPTMPSTPLPMPKVKEVEVQEWFKEEVWRLLGWEILSKEGNL